MVPVALILTVPVALLDIVAELLDVAVGLDELVAVGLEEVVKLARLETSFTFNKDPELVGDVELVLVVVDDEDVVIETIVERVLEAVALVDDDIETDCVGDKVTEQE